MPTRHKPSPRFLVTIDGAERSLDDADVVELLTIAHDLARTASKTHVQRFRDVFDRVSIPWRDDQ